ncbi:MAG: hypothetical protein ACK4NT_07220, partial [Candidatus Omnitrophota bacterium]
MNIEIRVLEKQDLEKIKPLIAEYKYNEYRNYKIFNQELREKILFQQIDDIIINKHGYCLVAEAKGNMNGLITLVNLPWDTKHFGMKMARIGHLIYVNNNLPYELINSVLKLCRRGKIKHLSFRVDTQDFSTIHALQKNGFYLVETLLTYIFTQADKISPLKDIYKVREFKKQDLPYLMEIARKSFTQNRFHLDPYIPKDKADSLYSEWIKNACLPRPCTQERGLDKATAFTFVVEKRNRPIGFFTCKLNQALLKWTKIKVLGRGLAAVLPEARGAY